MLYLNYKMSVFNTQDEFVSFKGPFVVYTQTMRLCYFIVLKGTRLMISYDRRGFGLHKTYFE